MTFVDRVSAGENIYVYPRKKKVSWDDVIIFRKEDGAPSTIEINYPTDKYVVISDKTLGESSLEQYLEKTKNWKK